MFRSAISALSSALVSTVKETVGSYKPTVENIANGPYSRILQQGIANMAYRSPILADIAQTAMHTFNIEASKKKQIQEYVKSDSSQWLREKTKSTLGDGATDKKIDSMMIDVVSKISKSIDKIGVEETKKSGKFKEYEKFFEKFTRQAEQEQREPTHAPDGSEILNRIEANTRQTVNAIEEIAMRTGHGGMGGQAGHESGGLNPRSFVDPITGMPSIRAGVGAIGGSFLAKVFDESTLDRFAKKARGLFTKHEQTGNMNAGTPSPQTHAHTEPKKQEKVEPIPTKPNIHAFTENTSESARESNREDSEQSDKLRNVSEEIRDELKKLNKTTENKEKEKITSSPGSGQGAIASVLGGLVGKYLGGTVGKFATRILSGQGARVAGKLMGRLVPTVARTGILGTVGSVLSKITPIGRIASVLSGVGSVAKAASVTSTTGGVAYKAGSLVGRSATLGRTVLSSARSAIPSVAYKAGSLVGRSATLGRTVLSSARSAIPSVAYKAGSLVGRGLSVLSKITPIGRIASVLSGVGSLVGKSVATSGLPYTVAGSAASKIIPASRGVLSGIGSIASRVMSSIPSVAYKAGSLVGRGLSVGKTVLSSAGAGVSKAAGSGVAKTLGKSFLKKIPLIGAVAGLGFGLQRLFKGDFTGAAMEVASGAASTVPGVGTAASVGMDVALAARDAKKEAEGTQQVDPKAADSNTQQGSTPNIEPAKSTPNIPLPNTGSKLSNVTPSEVNRSSHMERIAEMKAKKPEDSQQPVTINNITNNNSSGGGSGNGQSITSSMNAPVRNKESSYERVQMQNFWPRVA
jgi:hypothetical protein